MMTYLKHVSSFEFCAKRSLFVALAMLFLLVISGCSTVLHNEVRTEHDWPQQMADKTWQLRANASSNSVANLSEAEQSQQLAQATQLLQQQLQRLGFREVAEHGNLLVTLQLEQQMQSVYQLDDVLFAPHNRFGYSPYFGYWGRVGRPWHGYAAGRYPYSYPHSYRTSYAWPGFPPYVGPFAMHSVWLNTWPTATLQVKEGEAKPPAILYATNHGFGPLYVYRESAFPQTDRQIKVTIEQASDHKKLFEVVVANSSRERSDSPAAARILPFMLESAFDPFPGVSGQQRAVELKLE